MKKRNLLIIFVFIFVISICLVLNNKKDMKFDTNNDNANDDVVIDINQYAYVEYLYDLNDKNVLTDLFDYIAIIKIKSVDGVDNYDYVSNDYVSPYTYGKAEVLKVIKGNISNKEISYNRLGGKISFTKYIEGEEYKPVDFKRIYNISNIDDSKIIINATYSKDIDIEPGKIYLAFLEYKEGVNRENEYWIGGMEYGLRELSDSNISINNIDTIKVRNNTTKKYESINEVINLDIKK